MYYFKYFNWNTFLRCLSSSQKIRYSYNINNVVCLSLTVSQYPLKKKKMFYMIFFQLCTYHKKAQYRWLAVIIITSAWK